jgi:hypothetical protein
MIITIWWEDARQGQRSKNYGPNQLLAACVADELSCSFGEASRFFDGHPKKGVGNLMRGLCQGLRDFKLGPLCAVFDRDKVLDLWGADQRPLPCKSKITAAIREKAQSNCGVVLLFDNMESLVAAACQVLGRAEVPDKCPTTRDRLLQALAFHPDPTLRQRVRANVDGLDYLVKWTLGAIETLRRG